LQDEVDRGVEARAQRLAVQGLELACKRDCNGCCEEPIMIFRPEAARVAHWLDQPENAEARAAYPAWRDGVGDSPAKLSAKFAGDPGSYTRVRRGSWREPEAAAEFSTGDVIRSAALHRPRST
jgi:hypothetical protein